jgi:hypothetical protein
VACASAPTSVGPEAFPIPRSGHRSTRRERGLPLRERRQADGESYLFNTILPEQQNRTEKVAKGRNMIVKATMASPPAPRLRANLQFSASSAFSA